MKTCKTHIRKLSFALIAAAALLGAPEARAESPDDILVIGNKALAVDSLTPADVKRLYLKETETVGGQNVLAINAKDGPLRAAFRQKVLGMGKAEEEKFWQDAQVRSGKRKPKEFSKTLKAVFSVKKGISYCFRKDFKDGLAKVLLKL